MRIAWLRERLPDDGANRWIEPLFALAVFTGLVVAMRDVIVDGYLPQPFFFEPGDVWMDWFNTAAWARDNGMYETWGTVYPPLSFVFLRLVGINSCYAGIPNVAPGEGSIGWPTRDCDWLGAMIMHGIFVMNIFLVAKTFMRLDRRTAPWRAYAVAAGMPMLDGLERGNLILLTFTCFLLAYGPLVRSARVRWIAAGLAINFKIYLVSALFAQLLRRRWLWFEGALLATVAIYVLTWGLLGGRGTPAEIYDNIHTFSIAGQPVNFLDLWYACTYQPVVQLLDGSIFPIVSVIGSWRTETFAIVLPLATLAVSALIVAASAAAWLRPEAVPLHRLICLATGLALINAESGGYTQVIIIFMAMFERWRGAGAKWAILAGYVLCIPGDIYIDPLTPQLRAGFLAGPPVFYAYWVTMGPFLRPGLVMSIPTALACRTIADVWRDIRAQGWRNRSRFRYDLPLLATGGASPAA